MGSAVLLARHSLDFKGNLGDLYLVSALELVICVTLISVSAYLSASEIALFSLSRFQLRSLKEKFRFSHRKIKRLLADPGGLLISILVLNEGFNIALSAIIAESVAQIEKPGFVRALPVPSWAIDTLVGILVTAPIVLFLCEITPKVIAARANRLIAPATAGPLTVIYDVTKPVRIALGALVNWVGRKSASTETDEEKDDQVLKESEFLMMIEEGHKEGAIQQNELDLIKNVFELDDTKVAEVCTPLAMVQTLTETTTLKSALATMRSQKYSRIPITSANRRQVVGVLYSKDLLRAKIETHLMNLTVDSIMRKPLFVSPTMSLNSLFRKFKQQKTHMGVVQSTNGEALGIITMSDVLDALFEDLNTDDEGARKP
jgi:putative hemolysin